MALANNLGTQSVSTPSPTFKAGSPYTPSRSNNISSAGRIAAGGSNASYSDILKAISDANNAFNVAQVESVNAFNAREAQKNRDWQEYMSRHAHQIEVEDLKAAGLNPVLSALNGNGATVGSGAVASGQRATADNTLGSGLITLMSAMISAQSAMSIASMQAENARWLQENNPNTLPGLLNLVMNGNSSTGKNARSMFEYLADNGKSWYGSGVKGYINKLVSALKR